MDLRLFYRPVMERPWCVCVWRRSLLEPGQGLGWIQLYRSVDWQSAYAMLRQEQEIKNERAAILQSD